MQKEEKVKNLKVALVDDYLTVDGGAQRVLRVLHEIWPQAVVHAVTYFPEKFDPPLKDWDIRTSFVSKFPFSRRLEQQYKLFYPMAVETFDFTGYDLVFSMTSAGYAKAAIVPPDCISLCYINTVPRFLWGYRTSRHEQVGWLYKKIILPPLEHYWRIWDRQTAQRPDALMSNSENIAKRVQKAYRRESEVIYPPVEISKLLNQKSEKGDYFIYFGRLEKYKCVEMAIRACVNTSEKLRIVGSGSSENELKKVVKDLNADTLITFTGWVSDEKRNEEIAGAKAFIFPGPDEDFGIVLIEALAAGIPVIAFDSGGAGEIIEDGKTGILLKNFDQNVLNEVVKNFKSESISADACRERAKDFDVDIFKERIVKFVAKFV